MSTEKITRRTALKTATRVVALSGLVVGLGALVRREGCTSDGRCKFCNLSADCSLPDARTYRKEHQ